MKCRARPALLVCVSLAVLLLLVVFAVVPCFCKGVDLASMNGLERGSSGLASLDQAAIVGRRGHASPLNRTALITFTSVSTVYLPVVDRNYQVLYADSCNDPGSGWVVSDNGKVAVAYRDGGYEAVVRAPMWAAATTAPAGPFTSYAVEVDARRDAGAGGGYGLVFNWLDWQHFYLFIMYPDSQIFAVVRKDPAGYVRVTPPAFSAHINPGGATNRLRAESAGATARVYCNGQLLATASDGASTGAGYVGIHAEGSGSAPVTVRFDNFLVVSR